MIDRTPNDRIQSTGWSAVPAFRVPARRFRLGFDQPPEEFREKFFGDPVRRPLTAEDVRIHAWLSRRLAVLHYERHGLWPKLRRLLFGNRLARWLGLGSV
jgi:hypothetical protein